VYFVMTNHGNEQAAGNADAPRADYTVAEANHRVANSLTLIASLVRLRAARFAKQPETLSGRQAELLLREISAQIDGVGLLHQVLCRVPQSGQVDLQTYLADLCGALNTSFSFAGEIRFCSNEGTACLVSAEQAKAIGMLVNELAINAVKYAHPAGVYGLVEVACVVLGDGTLCLEVRDDGVGLPEGFDPATGGGLGFKVMRGVCEQLGARLEFDRGTIGLRVQLTLPAAARLAA
jgi:two-component sensor histidine kinase